MVDLSKEIEIPVILKRFNVPDQNGRIFSYQDFQRAIDANFLARISNRRFYGEFESPDPSLGVVRCTEVDEQNVCLRVKAVRLSRAGLFGRVVGAGPMRERFLSIVQNYKGTIPLAMRALVETLDNGGIVIRDLISFDFCAALLQGLPKIGDEPTEEGPTPTADTAMSHLSKDVNDHLATSPVTVVGTVSRDGSGQVTEETMTQTALRQANLTAQELDNLDAFRIYEDALNDPDFLKIVGRVVSLVTIADTTSITFESGTSTHQIRRHNPTNKLSTFRTTDRSMTGSPHPSVVAGTFRDLSNTVDRLTEQFLNHDQEQTDMVDTAETTKKPTAKAVFKAIKPIDSKNVVAHFDQVFRVNPKTKFDGYLKKLDGKAGAFVRVGDSEDIYVLPYTILSEKSSAAERSLRDALATRNVSIVDLEDLKPGQ